ncbi:MAG: cell envelope integrity protein TolA [Dissulfurispiraceae bacterium]|jgi:colicin import membrane protein
MKAPSLYSALSLSFFLHIVVITLSLYISRELYTRHLIVPYTVTLVYPTQTAGQEQVSQSRAAPAAAGQEIEKPAEKSRQEIKRPAEKPHAELSTETPHKKKADTTLIKNRIEELKAIQKIEKLVALRKIVDIGAKGREMPSKNRDNSARSGSGGTNSAGGDYDALVGTKIQQQWIYPESLHDLETLVIIKVAKDGSITIKEIEKSSGNPLFDRSVLRAINLASPLPPPLKETEIPLRFKP